MDEKVVDHMPLCPLGPGVTIKSGSESLALLYIVCTAI